MKYLLRLYLTIGLILVTSGVYAQDAKPNPVARVYDHLIYEADLNLTPELSKRFENAYTDTERPQKITEYKTEMLGLKIYQRLQDVLLQESNLEVTEQEIQDHMDAMRRLDEKRLGKFQKQRESKLKQLEESGGDEEKKATLEKQLKTLDQLIAFEQRQKEEQKKIPNYTEIRKQSQRKIADRMVYAWKFNKALYKKYGGRVIFQQFGLEPVDAFKEFVNEHQQNKDFEIMDTRYDDAFRKLYEYVDKEHTYVPKEEADKYFADPWWLKESTSSPKEILP